MIGEIALYFFAGITIVAVLIDHDLNLHGSLDAPLWCYLLISLVWPLWSTLLMFNSINQLKKYYEEND